MNKNYKQFGKQSHIKRIRTIRSKFPIYDNIPLCIKYLSYYQFLYFSHQLLSSNFADNNINHDKSHSINI